jgi:hypothetical protein
MPQSIVPRRHSPPHTLPPSFPPSLPHRRGRFSDDCAQVRGVRLEAVCIEERESPETLCEQRYVLNVGYGGGRRAQADLCQGAVCGDRAATAVGGGGGGWSGGRGAAASARTVLAFLGRGRSCKGTPCCTPAAALPSVDSAADAPCLIYDPRGRFRIRDGVADDRREDFDGC